MTNDKWLFALQGSTRHCSTLCCWLCTKLVPWENEEGVNVDPWAGRKSLCSSLKPLSLNKPLCERGDRAPEHTIGHLCLTLQTQPMHVVLTEICITHLNSSVTKQKRQINMAGLTFLLLYSHKAALGWRPSPSRDWWHHEREGNNEKHQDLECPGTNERPSYPLAAVHDNYSDCLSSAVWHQCSWVHFPLKVLKYLQQP